MLLVVVGACGDDGNFVPPADAPQFPDSPPDTPTSGAVTLTVTVGATPQANVKVYFQNADSSVVSATTTDANGVASAVMGTGGFVTAINPFPNLTANSTNELKTFAGVKPGDQLVLHIPPPTSTVVNVTVTLAADPNNNNTFYSLFAPCNQGSIDVSGAGSGAPPGGSFGLAGCGTTTDFTIVGRDVNFNPVSSFTAKDITLVDGGTIDLTAGAYAATETVTFDYSNVPANFGSVNVTSLQATTHGPQFDVSGGAILTGGAGLTIGQQRPVIAGAQQITSSNFGSNTFNTVLEWGASDATYQLDMANVVLHQYTLNPTLDVPSHAIVWTNDNAGQQPDLTHVFVSFQDTTTLDLRNWEIVAPHISSSVTLPLLPTADAALNPTANDTTNVQDLSTAKVPGGYDAIRANALSLGNGSSGITTGLVTGATGRVVIEKLQLAAVAAKRTAGEILNPFSSGRSSAPPKRR